MELKYQKVAVIMRTKDRNIFLKRAIQSVINQTYKGWVLVIVNDGGSISNLEKLLEAYAQYEDNIVVVNNEKSLGMEAASNKGIMAVNSDYIVIHDDDDTWEHDFLNKTINYLEAMPTCKGVITHSNKVIEQVDNENIKIKKIKPFNTHLKGIVDLYDLCLKNLFSPISFIYRRGVINEIGLYDESLPVLGDWDFNLRFIKKYDIHIIEERLANYHQRPQVKKGVYSNSIIGGRNMHLYYKVYLNNRILRDSLNKNIVDISIIAGLGIILKQETTLDKLKMLIKRYLFK